MDEDMIVETRPRRKKGVVTIAWLSLLYGVEEGMAAFGDNVRIIWRELNLFLGSALVISGLLGFNSDKYCDGNTADYLSCTRPTTYYYFDWLDIILVILGTFLVLLWIVRRRSAAS